MPASAVDITGTFLATKFAMTQFLKQDEDEHGFRGNIINILSIASSSGLPGCCKFASLCLLVYPSEGSRGYSYMVFNCVSPHLLAAYYAVKSAILGCTRPIAVEYAKRRIRCHVIKPGCSI